MYFCERKKKQQEFQDAGMELYKIQFNYGKWSGLVLKEVLGDEMRMKFSTELGLCKV